MSPERKKLSETQPKPEALINPKLAEEFLILLRGDPIHVDYRQDDLTEEQSDRAKQLIDEICLSTPAINRESLSRMMFDSPFGKNVPGSQAVFGWYDFGNIENWDKPPKGFLDQWKPYRLLARESLPNRKIRKKIISSGRTRD